MLWNTNTDTNSNTKVNAKYWYNSILIQFCNYFKKSKSSWVADWFTNGPDMLMCGTFWNFPSAKKTTTFFTCVFWFTPFVWFQIKFEKTNKDDLATIELPTLTSDRQLKALLPPTALTSPMAKCASTLVTSPRCKTSCHLFMSSFMAFFSGHSLRQIFMSFVTFVTFSTSLLMTFCTSQFMSPFHDTSNVAFTSKF